MIESKNILIFSEIKECVNIHEARTRAVIR